MPVFSLCLSMVRGELEVGGIGPHQVHAEPANEGAQRTPRAQTVAGTPVWLTGGVCGCGPPCLALGARRRSDVGPSRSRPSNAYLGFGPRSRLVFADSTVPGDSDLVGPPGCDGLALRRVRTRPV